MFLLGKLLYTIHIYFGTIVRLLLLDNNKIKMARKPEKILKKNLVMWTGEGKRWKGIIRKWSKEGETGTVLELSLEVRWLLWQDLGSGILKVLRIEKNEVSRKPFWLSSSSKTVIGFKRWKLLTFFWLLIEKKFRKV